MPVLDLNDKEKVDKYNKFLESNKASIMQDLRWANVKQGWIQKAVYLEENNEIIATMTILLQKLPMVNMYFMYASRGPICDVTNIELVNRLIKEADEIKKEYKVFVLKFDPEFLVNEDIKKLYLNNGFKIIENIHEVIQPKHNMVMNIKDKSLEELMINFAEKTRYNIKVAIKKGINVRYSNKEEDLKIFYEIYKTTTIRDNIGCRGYDYFLRMLKSYSESEIRIYIASHEKEDLSAAIAINYGKKVFYIYGASSNEKRNFMPNYLMQYEMIKWAVETKCETYDFGGVFEFTNENGLYKFKSAFCKQEGVTEYIGEIDKVYNKLIYFVYNSIVIKLNNLVKKIKKSLKKKNRKPLDNSKNEKKTS